VSILVLATALCYAQTPASGQAAAPTDAASEVPASGAGGPGASGSPADGTASVDQPVDPDEPVSIEGPKLVDLGKGLSIDLPAEYALFEQGEAKKMAERMGNFGNEELLAMVFKGGDWILTVEYYDEGYISDKDAAELDAKALLQSYKDGTEAANEERIKRGFGALHVEGWSQEPVYDKAAHLLTWGLIGKGDNGSSINHFTRLLGRKGYASIDLIASPEGMETAKTEAASVLSATTFKEGLRYEDFDPKSDKVAEYGLAALVLGGAGAVAAKSGLIAKLFALLLAGKKVIALALAGAVTAIKRFFGVKTDPPKAQGGEGKS
jgi:uncharacterized membrane-anchored protein